MSSVRNAILSRLRDAKPEAKTMEDITYQPWVSTDEKLITARFIKGLSASHAEVISTGHQDLSKLIEKVAVDKELQRIVLGTSGEFHEQIVQASKSLKTDFFDCDIKDWKSTLFNDVDAGITHCLAGIADTGTLVLWPDIAEPRTLSLVPPCHIALVKRSTIVSNFAELMEMQAWQNNMPTNIVLISGPSKTADIQQTLAYGAHGPSQLVVILIEDL
ncbi:lactate utilization protein C [Psychromonas sp. MB-3u-54]|uniref:LutC/YkgG family protein n=1 Tax=Psychromonas sp. MB-3u-54 TaxID=2058319 RepID=UPI000C34D1F5|nr:lactate utilization protein [Psychromonas sp. MB-3u-54]PKH03216.1 lactate utilization protein C [Psychromonas sp. MB-3u-54]